MMIDRPTDQWTRYYITTLWINTMFHTYCTSNEVRSEGIFNSQAGGGGARVLVMYYDEETRNTWCVWLATKYIFIRKKRVSQNVPGSSIFMILFKDPSWTECSVYINIVYMVSYIFIHITWIQDTIIYRAQYGFIHLREVESQSTHLKQNRSTKIKISRDLCVYI